MMMTRKAWWTKVLGSCSREDRWAQKEKADHHESYWKRWHKWQPAGRLVLMTLWRKKRRKGGDWTNLEFPKLIPHPKYFSPSFIHEQNPDFILSSNLKMSSSTTLTPNQEYVLQSIPELTRINLICHHRESRRRRAERSLARETRWLQHLDSAAPECTTTRREEVVIRIHRWERIIRSLTTRIHEGREEWDRLFAEVNCNCCH